MTQHGYDLTPRPPNTLRGSARVFGAVMLFAVVNAFTGWRVFRGYNGAVIGFSTLVGLLLLRLMPSVKQT
jgi:hypothetical protein